MGQNIQLDIHIQLRRMYQLLGEVQDTSRQLAEAVDRNDQVAIQMLMGMREEPLRRLVRCREDVKALLDSAPAEEGERIRALLNGEPARRESEKDLADQVGANTRLLKQVGELDEVLNRKIAREKSLYQ